MHASHEGWYLGQAGTDLWQSLRAGPTASQSIICLAISTVIRFHPFLGSFSRLTWVSGLAGSRCSAEGHTCRFPISFSRPSEIGLPTLIQGTESHLPSCSRVSYFPVEAKLGSSKEISGCYLMTWRLWNPQCFLQCLDSLTGSMIRYEPCFCWDCAKKAQGDWILARISSSSESQQESICWSHSCEKP